MQSTSGRSKNVTIAQYRARQVEQMNPFCTAFNQIQTDNKMFERPNRIKIDQEAFSSYIDRQVRSQFPANVKDGNLGESEEPEAVR